MYAIKVYRAERGWSISRLAKESGVPRETISRIEHGHNEPSAATIKKLADALGVTVHDLMLTEERFRGPLVAAPRSARQWLHEVVGHNYLAWNDQEATKLRDTLNFTEEIEGLRADLRDEYDVIREALDSRELDPELRTELEAAKKTLLQWHLELTKIVKPMRREQYQGLTDEEL